METLHSGLVVALEGPTASGKSILLKYLNSVRGFKVLRGMVSQDPFYNGFLVPKAQEAIEGIPLNYKEVLDLPKGERADIMDRSLRCTVLQAHEAHRLAQEGFVVILDRSAISHMALVFLAGDVGRQREDPKLVSWAEQTSKRVMETLWVGKTFEVMDGIINLLEPRYDNPRERKGMAGLEEDEGRNIRVVAQQISRARHIPIKELDTNSLTIGQEVTLVKEFVSSLS